jgi:hypothetical protein
MSTTIFDSVVFVQLSGSAGTSPANVLESPCHRVSTCEILSRTSPASRFQNVTFGELAHVTETHERMHTAAATDTASNDLDVP